MLGYVTVSSVGEKRSVSQPPNAKIKTILFEFDETIETRIA